jgi:bacterioferritin
MKGHKKVIELLNDVLTGELTSVNQYFIHAKMCKNWGYRGLAARVKKESIDEMKHADELIERILYLDGVPNLQRLHKVNVGETVPEQLKLDRQLEVDAVARLNKGIALCTEVGDNGSRELLEDILVSEEKKWQKNKKSLI